MNRLPGLLLAFTALLPLSAAEPLTLWLQSISAQGRMEVRATDAVPMQQLSLWAERSLKRLEEDWQREIPFQSARPFVFVIDSAAGSVQFRQHWEQQILRQTLRLPPTALAEEAPLLAEHFTRAMLYRVGIAAGGAGPVPRSWEAPVWMVRGTAHALLQGRSASLFATLVAAYTDSTPPFPEQISAGGAGRSLLRQEAEAALLCRWIFQQNAAEFWPKLVENGFRDSESWVRSYPQYGNLRELHMHWEVWWMNEKQQLTAELSLGEEARRQLESEREFIPAFYGLYVEGENRYQRLSFSGLRPYLADPRFPVAMQEWILRLQRLRFRQNPELNQEIENLQQAGRLAIRAAQTRGRKQERLWAEAGSLFEDTDE